MPRILEQKLPLIAGEDQAAIEAAKYLWHHFTDQDRVVYTCWAHRNPTRVGRRSFGTILRTSWLWGRHGSLLTAEHVPIAQIEAMFRSVPRKYVMSATDLAAFQDLPALITIWRGQAGRGQFKFGKIKGLSWTIDKACALWFANRNAVSSTKPILLRASVRRDFVLAYFAQTEAGESQSEIIVSREALEGISAESVERMSVPFHDRARLLEP